jgi:hypothetical protein
MWSAFIQTSSVQIGSNSETVEVIAEVVEGHVAAGMDVEIQLNRSISWSVPIIRVIEMSNNHINLMLDGEDNDGAAMIVALNFEDEMLVVSST